jgi:signal peptidase I
VREDTRVSKRRNRLRWLTDSMILILVVLLIARFTVQNFHIQGQSMEPTLHDQEFILVDKVAYLLRPPARGDVIVFQFPRDPQEDLVKRIIAVPGDVISVINQAVIVNGVTLHETYINEDDPYNPYPSFRDSIIEPNEYFVMGDNRGDSDDSRDWGLVPRQNIIGRVAAVYWPANANNFGLLPDASPVFARISSP